VTTDSAVTVGQANIHLYAGSALTVFSFFFLFAMCKDTSSNARHMIRVAPMGSSLLYGLQIMFEQQDSSRIVSCFEQHDLSSYVGAL